MKNDPQDNWIVAMRKELRFLESRRESGVATYADMRRIEQLRREIHDLEYQRRVKS